MWPCVIVWPVGMNKRKKNLMVEEWLDFVMTKVFLKPCSTSLMAFSAYFIKQNI